MFKILLFSKRWEIYKVDVDDITGEETLTTLPDSVDQLAPDSWNQAELILKPRTLMYGVYKLIFSSRMWDTNDADPLFTHVLPFVKVYDINLIRLSNPLVGNICKRISLLSISNYYLIGYLHLHRNCTLSTKCEYG